MILLHSFVSNGCCYWLGCQYTFVIAIYKARIGDVKLWISFAVSSACIIDLSLQLNRSNSISIRNICSKRHLL